MPYAILAAVLVAVDQIVKYLVMTNIEFGAHVPFIPHILEPHVLGPRKHMARIRVRRPAQHAAGQLIGGDIVAHLVRSGKGRKNQQIQGSQKQARA